jgi:prophage maintenance system killer protein
MSEILIYTTPESQTQVEVTFEGDTVWLTQKQIVDLFQSSKANISEHVKHIFEDGELDPSQTVRNFRTVQLEGKKKVSRQIDHYNLDLILSVGYRVNSKRGTQFRQWATQRLKDYLVKGYALNATRLKQVEGRYHELQQTVKLITTVASKKSLAEHEAKGILKILEQYSHALELLDQYDHQRLPEIIGDKKQVKKLSYNEAIKQIDVWRKVQKAGKLFGNEKDHSLKSSLNTIYQTFDGRDLYPTLEEKAAHLLYFVVKNHSFTDGNKRIAAGLFLYFMDMNKALLTAAGSKRMDDYTLVAVTLLIAESKPEEKEQIVKLILNLMSR